MIKSGLEPKTDVLIGKMMMKHQLLQSNPSTNQLWGITHNSSEPVLGDNSNNTISNNKWDISEV